MTDFHWGLVIAAVSVVLSGGASWYFSRMYYLKGAENQAKESERERQALIAALRANNNARDEALTMQQYIDAAVEAWRVKGTAVPYVDSLVGVTRDQKAQILRAASLRHKGREPKRNPFLSAQ
jgi:hypothetical protein